MGDFSAGYAGGYAKGMLENSAGEDNQRKLDLQAQSMMMDQENKNKTFELARAQLGMQQEELNMKKTAQSADIQEKDRQRQIEEGLGSALKTGGYTAAIEYLKGADPTKAIAYHSAKLALDKQIMENDTMKAIAPVEQQKAMFDSYALMGKFGAGIEKLPKEEQDKAWKLARPMISKIWTAAPEEYNAEAQVAMKLAISQATPENILYSAQQNGLTAKSQISKIGQDIESRIAAGHTPETDPTLRTLLAAQKGQEAKANAAADQELQTTMSMAKTQQDATEGFNKTLEKSSTDFLKAFDSYSQVKSNIEQLKKDPTNSYIQSTIQRMYIKAVNSGAMSIADEALGDSATGIPGLQKKIANMVKDQKTNLTEQETKALVAAWEATMQGKLNKQLGVESNYKQSGQNYPNIQWKAVRFPSQSYYGYMQKLKDDSMNTQVIDKLPPEMQVMAKDALQKAGGDPKKLEQVMQNIQTFLQKGQPQNGQPQMEAPISGQ